MLTIAAELLQGAIDHARLAAPLEACGFMAGFPGLDNIPRRRVAMVNTAANPRHFFQFSRTEQLIEWRKMDALGEDPLVFYHSHVDTPPLPSPTDVGLIQLYPGVHHLIISLASSQPTYASFTLRDGNPLPVAESIDIL